MKVWMHRLAIALVALVLAVPTARAQSQTGSITGTVTDTSGAILPGVTVALSGDTLIGGAQTQVTDAKGQYRFDRLPPGSYNVNFQLQGFKTVDRQGINISALFVATVNQKLDVGSLTETLTVTGEAPTIDTKSNVQQTVMNQALLEGVPTGRDPWSVAKLVPGMQVSTYDVGGTQGMQQSSLSVHGSSTNDVNFNIDGASINWPGGGGGATMAYFDQGMFSEINYTTSAIPAEVLVGGVSVNMVTKEAGNQWRGSTRYYYANDSMQGDNTNSPALKGYLGNPITRQYDFNLGGGGALVRNKLWLNGELRDWSVNKLTSAKNADGSRAIDDNTIHNYFLKGVWQAATNHKLALSYTYDNKVRGHRRNTPPNLVPDIASLHQDNPAKIYQAKYTGVFNKAVYESSFSVMSGQTSYLYQDGTNGAIRVVDNTLSTANFAAQYHEENPNSKLVFNNVLSYTTTKGLGDHLFKVGAQFTRLRYELEYNVNGDMYLEYNDGIPSQVREFNTPANSLSLDRSLGFFAQDSWTLNKLTLNYGARFDTNTGTIPQQSSPAGTFIGERTLAASTPVDQKLAVWRLGAVYDVNADGKTALKASYSRYGGQIGIDRVTNVNPAVFSNQTCPWSDLNGDGLATANEIGKCSGFTTKSVHYAGANGPEWPYSDEIAAGIERELPGDMRFGAMYYHRTNRNQIGTSNAAVPSSAYSAVTINVPDSPKGPGGTATLYNLDPAYLGLQDTTLDNQPYLNTNYNGVDLTLNKRMSNRWQMMGGLTLGKNYGGMNDDGGQSSSNDMNDPNNTVFKKGIIGDDSAWSFRLAGSYILPGEVTIAGSLIANQGYPYVSTYRVSRSIYPGLTRSSQTIVLSSRGDERLPSVKMVDLRFSRAIHFGGRTFTPQLDFFNIGNAATITDYNASVGGAYLSPGEILAPRIIRLGFTVSF